MLYATTLTTDLEAIRHNVEGVRARVGDRRVLVAVKANAYGHGAVEVSRMIERTGCADWLGVATVPEALELRDAGVTLPILKLSHCLGRDELVAAVQAGITLAVVDAPGIDAAQQVAAELGTIADVHLKIDTGMRRIGGQPDEAPDLCRRVDAASHLRLGGLFSHMPVSDTEGCADFTRGQIERFAAAARASEDARGPIPLKHLAASGGVLMHPEAWFDMVRPGVMAYGSLPDPTTTPTVDLRAALRWTTRVTFMKPVAAGETVGYGRTFTAASDTIIGTIPVGYGDGFSRANSNTGRVLIDGRSYPIAGRVCMDQTMVDLGPDARVRVGDEVVLLGESGHEQITAQELADRAQTITYEVTCDAGLRASRQFVGA